MRIATYEHAGQRLVGQVSQDGLSVTAFALPPDRARLGALSLIERGDWRSLPTQGAAVALQQVQLLAPLPHPRRNLFCVGRNYHEHAKELRDSVFKNNNANVAAWPTTSSWCDRCARDSR